MKSNTSVTLQEIEDEDNKEGQGRGAKRTCSRCFHQVSGARQVGGFVVCRRVYDEDKDRPSFGEELEGHIERKAPDTAEYILMEQLDFNGPHD